MVRGVKFGRKPKMTGHQIAEAIAWREAGEAADGYRAELQRQSQHDFQVGGLTVAPLGISAMDR